MATDDSTAESGEHSVDNTKGIIEEFRTYITEDEEGDLDMYSKVSVATPNDPLSPISVKLDDDGSGLSYMLTITPIED